jgi:hypothetical protein
MWRELQEEYYKWGLTVNSAKTKYMSLGNDKNHLEMDNSDVITALQLCIFTEDGRDTKNISHRVAQARKIIGVSNGIWWAKGITTDREKMIYNSRDRKS